MEFRKSGVNFKEQALVDINYGGKNIGRYFLDFVIENKIVLEIKISSRFYMRDVKQVLSYLKAAFLPLGILAAFNRNELRFKRILQGNTD